MTYDDLVLNDKELLEVFEVAKQQKTLVMVHAEGYDAIKFLTKKSLKSSSTKPFLGLIGSTSICKTFT